MSNSNAGFRNSKKVVTDGTDKIPDSVLKYLDGAVPYIIEYFNDHLMTKSNATSSIKNFYAVDIIPDNKAEEIINNIKDILKSNQEFQTKEPLDINARYDRDCKSIIIRINVPLFNLQEFFLIASPDGLYVEGTETEYIKKFEALEKNDKREGRITYRKKDHKLSELESELLRLSRLKQETINTQDFNKRINSNKMETKFKVLWSNGKFYISARRVV